MQQPLCVGMHHGARVFEIVSSWAFSVIDLICFAMTEKNYVNSVIMFETVD